MSNERAIPQLEMKERGKQQPPQRQESPVRERQGEGQSKDGREKTQKGQQGLREKVKDKQGQKPK